MNVFQPNWKDELKRYIKNRILFKSDEYYSDLILDDFEITETKDYNLAEHARDMKSKGIEIDKGKTYYDLKFKINSESYKLWTLYQDKDGNITPDDVMALDVPNIVKNNFIETMNDLGVDGAMEKYNLFNRGAYRTVAIYHHVPTLEKIIGVLKEFEVYRRNAVGVGFKFEEMTEAEEVKAFCFVRKTRAKKQTQNSGNSLEKNIINGSVAIFGREVS